MSPARSALLRNGAKAVGAEEARAKGVGSHAS